MIVDLVQSTTEDGLRLDGVLQQAEATNRQAVICLHGVGGNFYGSTLLESVAHALLQSRWDVLRANTRGHDAYSIAQSTSTSPHQGAAFETVDECRFDITAWVRFLQDRDYQRVLLLGHSLGAVKAIYAQAQSPQPAVCGVIAISPPRLSCQAFQEGPQGARFFQTLSEAQQHVAADQPATLLQTRVPVPLLISAAGFLDKYGPEERYNFLRFASQVDCPLLFTFGSQELEHGGVAFAGLPDAIARLAHQSEKPWQPDVTVIEGADHHYRSGRDTLNRELSGWLQGQNLVSDQA